MANRKSDISPELVKAVSQANPAIWAETYLKTEFGIPFRFDKHKYLLEPMLSQHPRVSVRKGTQGGWTLAMMIKSLHALIFGPVTQGVIYIFPTDIKVGEFSQLRWTPLLDHNPVHIAKHVIKTNNVHNKRIGQGNLMMRGAQLTTRIGGVEAESASARSDPADVLVFDEKDLFPPKAIGKYEGRLGHSLLKWQWSLSNPTIPDYGIDLDWQAGDERHLMIRCDACNAWTCLEIEMPGCLRRMADGQVIRACVHCGRQIDIDRAQWVPKYPSRSKDHVSYWWSQLNSQYVTAAELLGAYEHPPRGDLGDVMRLKFGLPYLDSQYGLSSPQILLCCTQEPAATHSLIQTAIGVDVGPQWLHTVVGYRVSEDAYRIIACLLVRDFDELKRTARAFRAGTQSVDNEPEIRQARNYQATGQGRIWLSDYTEAVGPAAYDVATGVVRVNRTEILDDTHYYLSHPGRLLLPKENQFVTMFAEQCATMVKVILRDEVTGKTVARYITRDKGGVGDHFRHAFANFLLAAKTTTAQSVITDRQTKAGSHHRPSVYEE